MWTLAAGCQLVDIAWSSFILAGIEHADADPSLPGSPLVLYDMPWTHSLPMTFVWSIGAALTVRFLLRLPWWTSAVVGLAVASHWVLDLIVHRPDLELWFGDGKVGFALWNYPVPEQALEIGLVAVFGAAWAASRKGAGRAAWPAVLLVAFLVALQIAAMLMPPPAGPLSADTGLTALAIYIVVIAAAALTDIRGKAAA